MCELNKKILNIFYSQLSGFMLHFFYHVVLQADLLLANEEWISEADMIKYTQRSVQTYIDSLKKKLNVINNLSLNKNVLQLIVLLSLIIAINGIDKTVL